MYSGEETGDLVAEDQRRPGPGLELEDVEVGGLVERRIHQAAAAGAGGWRGDRDPDAQGRARWRGRGVGWAGG